MTPGRLKIWNEDAGEWQYTPGGSQPGAVRLLDLGVVEATDLAAGLVTLYTPDAGELVIAGYITDLTAPDTQALGLWLGDGTSFRPQFLAAVGAIADDAATGGGVVSSGLDVSLAVQLSGDPVRAGLCESPGFPLADVWQANHVYVPDSVFSTDQETHVIGGGHLWFSGAGGTSGNSEPDWAAHYEGSVTDGDITWTDEGAVPTTGSMHAYITVSAPAAP